MNKKAPWPCELENDAAVVIGMLLRARDNGERLPVMTRATIRRAREVLGIRLEGFHGTLRWKIAPDWPDRIRRAGIDPGTFEVVDPGLWRVAQRGVDQRRRRHGLARWKNASEQKLKEDLAKYAMPKPASLSEIRAKHFQEKRLLKEIEDG